MFFCSGYETIRSPHFVYCRIIRFSPCFESACLFWKNSSRRATKARCLKKSVLPDNTGTFCLQINWKKKICYLKTCGREFFSAKLLIDHFLKYLLLYLIFFPENTKVRIYLIFSVKNIKKDRRVYFYYYWKLY